MVPRTLIALVLCGSLFGAKKPQPIADGMAGNADVNIKAVVYADPENVLQILGSDLDGHYIVVKVDLTPKNKFTVDLDNFLLKTDKDGERSHPFKPTQIAGDGALVISDTALGGGGVKQGNPRGPVWGGGIGGGSGVGNTATQTGSKATMQAATGKKSPILDTLSEKMLPEKETEQPVSGLVYFPMEKQKVKDLELIVTTPSGKLNIRFTK
jgi:hypothetical protein